MNAQHGLTGAVAVLAPVDLAMAAGLVTVHPLGAGYLALVAAGAATAPDMDQPGGSPSRSFGPLSMGLSRFLAHIGARIQQATRTPVDYVDEDGHRTITHGYLAAVSMGLVIGATCVALGPWAVVFTGWVFGSLALRALLGRKGTGRFWARWLRRLAKALTWVGKALPRPVREITRALATLCRWLAKTAYRWEWLTTNLTALGLALAGPALAPEAFAVVGGLGPVLGLVIAVGMFTHCLGDCPSVLGCPLWAPHKIAGRRWYRVRFTAPAWARRLHAWIVSRRIIRWWVRDVLAIPEGKPGRGFTVGGRLEAVVIRRTLLAITAALALGAVALAVP